MTPGKGTYEFAAPEVYLRGADNYSLPIDVWSFGVMLAQLVSSVRFVGQKEFELYLDWSDTTLFYSYLKDIFEDGREVRMQLEVRTREGFGDFTRALILDTLQFNP